MRILAGSDHGSGAAMLALATLLAGAFGCESPTDARLLEVYSAHPETLQPGSLLTLDGNGFPPGRHGTVVFEGWAHRPGAPPVEIRFETRARASSTERLSLVAPDTLFSAVGGRATFEGCIRVSFPASQNGGTVSGQHCDATLNLTPSAGHLEAEVNRLRSAERLLDYLGLGLVAIEDQGRGTVIGVVRPSGPGERAGILTGDRIVSASNVQVQGPSDLPAPPGADSIPLVLERLGRSTPIHVRISLAGLNARPASGDDPRLPLLLLGILLASVFLFLAPTARILAVVPHAIRDPGPRTVNRNLQSLLFAAASTIAALLAFGALPLGAHLLPDSPHVGLFLAATYGGVLAARVLEGSRRGIRQLAGSALCTALAVGVAIALCGDFRLESLIASQGGWPWEWTAMKSPFGFVALPVFVGGAFVLPAPTTSKGSPGRPISVLSQTTERIYLFVMCALCTALFLGGWRLPGQMGDPMNGGPTVRVLASLAYVAKTLSVYWLAIGLRRMAGDRRLSSMWLVAGGGVCLGALVLILMRPDLVAMGEDLGPALSIVSGAAALWCAHRVLLHRRAEPHIHAFL